MKGDVQDNVLFFDDKDVIYPIGDNVVIYDTVRKTQKFFNSGNTPNPPNSGDVVTNGTQVLINQVCIVYYSVFGNL